MKLDAMDMNMFGVKRVFTEEDLKEMREVRATFRDYLLRKMNTDSSSLPDVTDGVRVYERLVFTMSMK